MLLLVSDSKLNNVKVTSHQIEQLTFAVSLQPFPFHLSLLYATR